jgi:hypothetical protein
MSSDNEISEQWKEHREAQQKRRQERLPGRTEEIKNLVKEGFHIEQKTEYQFRVNEQLDLYPIHNRYHDIKANKRGSYKHVTEFVKSFFRKHTHK